MAKRYFLIPFLLLFVQTGFAQTIYTIDTAKASIIAEAVLKASPVIDGHNDLFVHYFDCKNCPRGLADYPLDTFAKGHTDIPKMRQGKLGGVLMNVFGADTGFAAYDKGWELLYEIQRKYSKDISIAATSTDMRQALKQNKIAFLPILEGAKRLNNDTAVLRRYYNKGLRSVTLAYKTNGLADGSDDTVIHHGISAAGKTMVGQMNKLGVIIDMSHISAKAMNDILDITKAPVIFSHSNAKALCDVNRNVPDSVLLRLKKNRGIIMLTFVPYFVNKTHMQWLDSGDTAYYKAIKDFPKDQNKVDSIMMQWEKNNIAPVVTVANMADHFDYVKKLIGVDYIGMAGDYDGIDYTIKGLENISTYPTLVMELARRGWTESDLKKITGENFLRVFEEVEKVASNR